MSSEESLYSDYRDSTRKGPQTDTDRTIPPVTPDVLLHGSVDAPGNDRGLLRELTESESSFTLSISDLSLEKNDPGGLEGKRRGLPGSVKWCLSYDEVSSDSQVVVDDPPTVSLYFITESRTTSFTW